MEKRMKSMNLASLLATLGPYGSTLYMYLHFEIHKEIIRNLRTIQMQRWRRRKKLGINVNKQTPMTGQKVQKKKRWTLFVSCQCQCHSIANISNWMCFYFYFILFYFCFMLLCFILKFNWISLIFELKLKSQMHIHYTHILEWHTDELCSAISRVYSACSTAHLWYKQHP